MTSRSWGALYVVTGEREVKYPLTLFSLGMSRANIYKHMTHNTILFYISITCISRHTMNTLHLSINPIRVFSIVDL